MAQDNTTNILNWGRLVLFALALLIVYKLLKKFGLFGKTEDELKTDQLAETINPDQATGANLSFWERAFKKYGINKDIWASWDKSQRDAWLKRYMMPHYKDYTDMVTKIKYADKTFNDDEESVYSVFRRLSTKYEVNFVAKLFQNFYKYDMFAYMKNFMDDSELAIVYNIVDRKPEF